MTDAQMDAVPPAWGTPDSLPSVPGVDPTRLAALDLAVRLRYAGKHVPGEYRTSDVINDARQFERYLRGEGR